MSQRFDGNTKTIARTPLNRPNRIINVLRVTGFFEARMEKEAIAI